MPTDFGAESGIFYIRLAHETPTSAQRKHRADDPESVKLWVGQTEIDELAKEPMTRNQMQKVRHENGLLREVASRKGAKAQS